MRRDREESLSGGSAGGRLQALAGVLEVETVFLEQCVRCGALILEDLPEGSEGLPPSQLARLRRLQRMCRNLEIDVFAACIILDLIDRMDGLQRELERLRSL